MLKRETEAQNSQGAVMTVMELAASHYCNAKEEQTCWQEEAIKTGMQV